LKSDHILEKVESALERRFPFYPVLPCVLRATVASRRLRYRGRVVYPREYCLRKEVIVYKEPDLVSRESIKCISSRIAVPQTVLCGFKNTIFHTDGYYMQDRAAKQRDGEAKGQLNNEVTNHPVQ
jgi:hypothetical protein